MQKYSFRTPKILLFAYGIFILLLSPYASAESAVTQVSAQQVPPPAATQSTMSAENSVPLSVQFFVDEQGTLLLKDIVDPKIQSAFIPYAQENLLHKTGIFWLRIPLNNPSLEAPVLNLNTRLRGQLPGTPHVWLVQADGTSDPLRPVSNGLYPLPSLLMDGATIYIRVNGMFGTGFEPSLVSKASLGTIDEIGEGILLAALAIALFICLLRGLTERREWRLWAALYIGAVWAQSFWGLPETGSGMITRWDLPGLLAPGVALLLLPHVGRHIMQTYDHAHVIDLLYVFSGLLGILLITVPLIPDCIWLLRYLPFWPLFLILLLPLCLIACLCNLPGAKRFFLICLLPPLGIIAPYLSTFSPNSIATSGIMPLFPTIGLTLSAILTALCSRPKLLPAPNRKKNNHRIAGRQSAASTTFNTGVPLRMDGIPELVLHTTDAQPAGGQSIPDTVPTGHEGLQHEHSTKPTLPSALRTTLTSGQVEGLLRTPLDVLLREIAALDQMPLNPDAKVRLNSLIRTGKTLTWLIGNMSRTAIQPEKVHDPQLTETFDLNQLLLEVHDAVEEQAENKNLSLTWFTAPYLPRYYEGQRIQLVEVLKMLAESAILATEHGLVQIRVQRVPESTDPGHLLFTISDTGTGTPPFTRSSLAFTRVWELAAAGGNEVSLINKSEGTTISFSMHLSTRSAEVPMAKTNVQNNALISKLPASSLRILVVSSVPANRQLLAYYLDELPHEILEARNTEDAQQTYFNAPGALLIFDDDIPEGDLAKTIAAIRIFEGEHNFPLVSILALVSNDEQAARLRRMGCTHTLMKPVARKDLRHLALRLAPVPRKKTAQIPITQSAEPEQPASQAVETPIQPSADLPLSEQPQTLKKRPGFLARLFKRDKKPGNTTMRTPLLPSESPVQENIKLSSVGDPMPITSTAADKQAQPESAVQRVSLTQKIHTKAPHTGHERHRPSQRHQPAPAVHTSIPNKLYLSTDEWVGEPTPIVSKPDAATSTATVAPQQKKPVFAAPPDSIEWVGEPMPIRKQSISSSQETPLSLSPQKKAEDGKKEAAQPFRSKAPDNCVEWVGEPMPITSQKEPPLTLQPPTDTGREQFDISPDLHEGTPSNHIITLSKAIEEIQLTPDSPAATPSVPDLFDPLPHNSVKNVSLTEHIVELDNPIQDSSIPEPDPSAKQQHDEHISEEPAADNPTATTEKTFCSSEEELTSNTDTDATIHRLLQELDMAMEQIIAGQKSNDSSMIHKSATRIVKLAETFDLRVLDDPAHCIELAAEKDDLEEVAQFIPDLAAAITRNRASFEETS